jgi:hypothetical protein
VCGCNGITYENDCERIRAGVPLRFNGTCPLPPPPEWDASCRVVLETLWGTDIQSFYGIARNEATPNRAVADARNDGLAQCGAAQAGHVLFKCTVDNGQCAASPAP